MSTRKTSFNPRSKKQWAVALATLLAFALSPAADAARKKNRAKPRPAVVVETYKDNAKAAAFVQDMQQHGLDADWVRTTLDQARKLHSVRRAVLPIPSGQRKNWQAYRDRFVEPARTNAGKAFLQQHQTTLQRAHAHYGVPVGVILGVLGVETFYGRDTGSYRVVESLATLAFDYPTESGKDRSPFFREQLAQFFIWCAKEQCQPLEAKGSYAGAMGLPQFMPGNIARYAVDFDGDGHTDLRNPVDAIGSVASFLAQHGWVSHLVPVYQTSLHNPQLETLLKPDIVPTFRPWQLAELGVHTDTPIEPWEKFALIELQNGAAPNDYFIGSQNFYVLTRYNRSSYYAMAVLALGQAVLAGEQAGEQGVGALSRPHPVTGKAQSSNLTLIQAPTTFR